MPGLSAKELKTRLDKVYSVFPSLASAATRKRRRYRVASSSRSPLSKALLLDPTVLL